jgi:hypothetical protein
MNKWETFGNLACTVIFSALTWGFYQLAHETGALLWKGIFWCGILSAGFWALLMASIVLHTLYHATKEKLQ